MTLQEWTENFGDNLAELIKDRKMSQRELSQASGVSIGSISAYLHYQSQPGIKAIINLADALDVDVSELIDFGDIID
jgi:transcriptional regulator with XRE-family HTH domain